MVALSDIMPDLSSTVPLVHCSNSAISVSNVSPSSSFMITSKLLDNSGNPPG